MNRYEMEPILNPSGRFVIYGDHLNAIEGLQARITELEAELAKPIEPIGTGLIREVLDQRDRYRREFAESLDWIGCLVNWIDFVPKDTPLPAMPGFDRDDLDAFIQRNNPHA